jgi:hypothetical protein
MLSHYVNTHQTDWDQYLPYVLYAYRTAPQQLTKQSPFFLLYGREARFPMETFPFPSSTPDQQYENVEDYVVQLVEKLKIAHSAVFDRVQQTQANREQQNSVLENVTAFPVGSKVLLYTPAVKPKTTKKLAALWKGPYEVIEQYNNKLNYKIHLLDKKGRKVNSARSLLVHVGRLKQYFEPNSSAIRRDADTEMLALD